MSNIQFTRVALNLPANVALLILHGRHVVQAMKGNTWFPSPTPDLAKVMADLDALEAAEIAAHDRTAGAVHARNARQLAVHADLVGLVGHVEMIANQNPDKALLIITSAGLTAKQHATVDQVALVAMLAKTKGTVQLRARAYKGNAAYEWQMSADGGETWAAIALTTVAKVAVPGLEMLKTYHFRFRITVGTTPGDWSDPVSILVH